MKRICAIAALAGCLMSLQLEAQQNHSYKQFVCEKGGESVNYNYGIRNLDTGEWVMKPMKFKDAAKTPGSTIIRACDIKVSPSVWAGYMWIKGENIGRSGVHVLTSGWYRLCDDGTVSTIIPNGKYAYAACCSYATTPLFICRETVDGKSPYDVINGEGRTVASGSFKPYIGVSGDRTYIFQKWPDGHWTVLNETGSQILTSYAFIEPLAVDEDDLSVTEADYVKVRQGREGKWGLASIGGRQTLDYSFDVLDGYQPDDNTLAKSGVNKFKAGFPFVKAKSGDFWGVYSCEGATVIPAMLGSGLDGALDEALNRLPSESYGYFRKLQTGTEGATEDEMMENFCKYCVQVAAKGEYALSYGEYNSSFGMLKIECSATPRNTYWLAMNRKDVTAFQLAFGEMERSTRRSLKFFILNDGLAIAEMTFKIPSPEAGEAANPLAGRVFHYINPALEPGARVFSLAEVKY